MKLSQLRQIIREEIESVKTGDKAGQGARVGKVTPKNDVIAHEDEDSVTYKNVTMKRFIEWYMGEKFSKKLLFEFLYMCGFESSDEEFILARDTINNASSQQLSNITFTLAAQDISDISNDVLNWELELYDFNSDLEFFDNTLELNNGSITKPFDPIED